MSSKTIEMLTSGGKKKKGYFLCFIIDQKLLFQRSESFGGSVNFSC